MTPSFSIMTVKVPRDLGRFGLTFACGTCGLISSVTLELGKDGIELSDYLADANLSQSSPCSRLVAVTGDGRVSISCGYCRSGKTILEVSLPQDGTSYSLANSELTKHRLEHEETFKPWDKTTFGRLA